MLWPSSVGSGLVACQHTATREGGSPRERQAGAGAEGEGSPEMLRDAVGDLGGRVGWLKGGTSPSVSSACGKDVPRGIAVTRPAGGMSCLADAESAVLCGAGREGGRCWGVSPACTQL